METLKTPETLDEGLVISELGQAQYPCNQVLEEVSEVAVSVEKCNGPVSLSVGQAQNPCDEILGEVSELAVSAEKCMGSVLPAVVSVEENACAVDSGSKAELPRNGISLFVELNGSVQGGSSDLGRSVSLENNLFDGSLLLDDGNLSAKIGNEVEGEEAIGAAECRFNVDDLVWAKNKTQFWLPGIIYDPSDAPKEAAKPKQTDSLLVKCFANGSYVWCLPSQLKPFLEYFEKMSKQSISKSFLGALEKAVAEVGRRAKMEMTCSCFSNGSRDKMGNFSEFSMTQFEPASFIARIKSLAQDVSGPNKIESIVIQNRLSGFYRSIGHSQIPLHQLKPANVGKNTARASEGTTLEKKDKELTKLFGENTNKVNKLGSSKSVKIRDFSLENGDMSGDGKSGRERRKSRYLSYPYVNLALGRKGLEEDEVEDSKEVSPVGTHTKSSQSVGSPSTYISDGKKPQRKWSRKDSTGNDVSGQAVEIKSSPAEVLSELRYTAIDCLYPSGNKQFGSVVNFLSGYRNMAFQDFRSEIAGEHTVGQEFDHLGPPSQTLPEVKVQSDKGMAISIRMAGNDLVKHPSLNALPKKRGRQKKDKLSDSKTFPISILPEVKVRSDKGMSNSVGIAGNDSVKQPLPNALPKKRGRKKMEKISDAKSFPTPILSGPTHGSVMIDFQNVVPVAGGANQGIQQIEVMPLNGKTTILNFEDSQVTGPPGPPQGKLQPKRRKKKEEDASDQAKLDSMLQEVHVMGPCSIQTIPELNNKGIKESVALHLNFEVPAGHTDITGNNTGQSQMGILAPTGSVEPMKRKRKEKSSELHDNVAAAIPDLNGIGAAGKPQKRRRKRINKAEACIDYNKLQNNGEVSGTVLLLKFGPGEPLPSKESLISAFCGFGPLKEPETRALDGSDIAQVVFESSSNARDAFRSLEKNSPFGPGLVNFQLHNFSGDASQGLEGNKSPLVKLPGEKPQQKEAQDLPGIRKNLEMMTSMLEKAGANLSPEMRAKLESEVKGLLKKVSDMVGTSSS